MGFKDREHYIDWVFRSYIRPYEAWKKICPTLPRVFSPRALGAGSARVPLVASFGLGVSGGLQIALSRSFRGPVIWLAASNAERRSLRKLLFNPKVAVVPYPLDTARLERVAAWRGGPAWTKERSRFFRRHGLDPEAPTYYFCGRITPSKGLHHLVALAERQRVRVQLVLAGMREKAERFSGEEAAAWKRIHASKHCRVVWLGRVTPLRNYRLLTLADACVALSTDGSEDFGFLPRQALALGTPVLITGWGGLADIRLPTRLDRLFIERVPVVIGVRGVAEPDLSSFDLARHIAGARALTGKDRRQAAKAILTRHAQWTRSGLEAAHQLQRRCLRNAQSRAGARVRFRSFSGELILAASSKRLLDARLHYPVEDQLKVMVPRATRCGGFNLGALLRK